MHECLHWQVGALKKKLRKLEKLKKLKKGNIYIVISTLLSAAIVSFHCFVIAITVFL